MTVTSETRVSAPVATPTSAPARTRTFLPYIDGMRGFFGVYIGLSHLWYMLTVIRPRVFSMPSHYVAFAHCAVAMFIVASGYLIGMPVARDGQMFRGGLGTYARRRALRILPAYYAALLVSIPISWFCAAMYDQALTTHDFAISTILHAFMVHNFSDHLTETIDGPMWSVAIECDIYVLFPLMLVPLARRFGFVPMVFTSFGIGLIPTLIGALSGHPTDYRLAGTCPWYIGLFAVGYAAANLSVERNPAAMRLFDRCPWGALAIVLTAAMAIVVARTPASEVDLGNGNRWVADVLVGLALAAQFTADAQARKRGTTSWFERFFSWRPLLFLGTFSYSYYLVHLPVMELVVAPSRPSWSNVALLLLSAAALAAGLLVAYAIYVIVERPSMTAYRRRGDAASLRSAHVLEIVDTAPAVVSPATTR